MAARDIIDVNDDSVILKAGELITDDIADMIRDRMGVNEVEIRSVLTCETRRGICAKCYGTNLAKNRLVEVGEAVGVIASQSIGEPGTQLTLRTSTKVVRHKAVSLKPTSKLCMMDALSSRTCAL